MIMVHTPCGNSILIDCGAIIPSEDDYYVTAARDWLKKRHPGVTDPKFNAVVLTHAHTDHDNMLGSLSTLTTNTYRSTAISKGGLPRLVDQTSTHQIIVNKNYEITIASTLTEKSTEKVYSVRPVPPDLARPHGLTKAYQLIEGDKHIWVVAPGTGPYRHKTTDNTIRTTTGYLSVTHQENAASLIILFKIGAFKYLFTGDSDVCLSPLIKQLGNVTGLHIPHHGSDENTQMVPKTVRGEYARQIIADFAIFTASSTGNPGQHALPKAEAINAWATCIREHPSEIDKPPTEMRTIRGWHKLPDAQEVGTSNRPKDAKYRKSETQPQIHKHEASFVAMTFDALNPNPPGWLTTQPPPEQATRHSHETEKGVFRTAWSVVKPNIFSTMNGTISIDIDDRVQQQRTITIKQSYPHPGCEIKDWVFTIPDADAGN
ncbi:MAG: hypothetical protein RL173_366 [Fibrobacterota bacterium]